MLSSLVLVVAAVVVATGVFVGVFSVAFLDDCSPPTCRADDAWIAVGAALAAAVVLGLAGLVVTIVRLPADGRRGRSRARRCCWWSSRWPRALSATSWPCTRVSRRPG